MLVILLPLGSFQRITITPTVAFYLHELIICCWLVVVWTKHFPILKSASSTWYQTHRRSVVGIFGLWVVFSWLLGSLVSGVDWLSLAYHFRLGCYLWWGLTVHWLSVRKLLPWTTAQSRWLLLGTGVVTTIWGLLQYLLLPDLRFLAVLGWDPHYFRMIGTWLDPNFLGLAITIWLIINLGHQPDWLSNNLRTALLILFSIALSLTFSRASWLAAMLSGSFLCWHRLRLRTQLTKIVTIIVLTIILAPKPGGEGVNITRTATIYARTDRIWNQLAGRKPDAVLIGTGLFRLKKTTPTQIPFHGRLPDSLPVTIWLGTGLIGVVLSVLVSWQLFEYLHHDLVASTALVAIFTHSFFNNSLLHPLLMVMWLWLVAQPVIEKSKSH